MLLRVSYKILFAEGNEMVVQILIITFIILQYNVPSK